MSVSVAAPSSAGSPRAAPPSVPAALLQQARGRGDTIAFRHKRLGRWSETNWRQYAERVARVALGLLELGVTGSERVAVHSENRPEWALADLAIQGIGAATVGIYPTSPATEVEYLLGHSESVVLICEDEEQLDKAMEVRERLPALRRIVVVDPRGVRVLDDPMVMTFAQLEECARDADPLAAFTRGVGQLDPLETAIVIYTSGTTGPPKGAMLSHANLSWAADAFGEAFAAGPDDEVLSYLPLSHVVERLLSVMVAVRRGYVVNFGEGADAFAQDVRDVQPTIFLGVPRVWERMLSQVEIRMRDATRAKRTSYTTAMRVGQRLAARRMSGQVSPLDRATGAASGVLVQRPLREKLGLARVRTAISGAAPVAPEVLNFFWALGVPVREGYGQTENCAVTTFMPADDVRVGSVGRALPGVTLRIAHDGEILVRSPGVFRGYLGDEAASRSALDDEGWLHTGDVGELDADGFLRITDRKKDIIITAGGKNISPSEIENKLKVSPYVREAVVLGDRRKYLAALIGIERDTVADWATRRGIAYTTYRDLTSKPEVHALVGEWIDQVNAQLARVETIKRYALLDKELDHEEGELTATQKVKRQVLERQFVDVIERLYS